MFKPKPKILCVDDDIMSLELLEATLVPSGYEVVFANSGKDTQERIGDHKIDLVLLDVRLKGESGYDICRRIRADKRSRNIPVVMVTLLTSTEERIKSIEAGADDFISKPFDHTELVTRIKMLLKMKDLHDSLDASREELQSANEKLLTVNNELYIRNAEMGEANSELLKLNDLLTHQAITDKLTGASNRHKFDDAFKTELMRSKRFTVPLSLIMFDIDLFKTINDTAGHLIGDEVIRELAVLVRKSVRIHDTFARWGGDEFMIMMVNSDEDHARMFAEKLRRGIEDHSFPSVDRLTCSFGVAQLMDDETAERLWQRVDAAMYAAKRCGRNNVQAAGAADRRGKDPCAPGAHV